MFETIMLLALKRYREHRARTWSWVRFWFKVALVLWGLIFLMAFLAAQKG